MPRYDTPEMLRLSLDAVVLKVKMLGIRTSPAPRLSNNGGEAEGVQVQATLKGGAAPAAASSGGGGGGKLSAPSATALSSSSSMTSSGGGKNGPNSGSSGSGTSAKAVLALSLQSPDDDNVDVALTKL